MYLIRVLAGLPVEIVAELEPQRPQRREEPESGPGAQPEIGRVEVVAEAVGVAGVEEEYQPEPREHRNQELDAAQDLAGAADDGAVLVLRPDLPGALAAQGAALAPLPPPAADDLGAIGRTNDCVLYGARVVLYVRGDDRSLLELGPRVPSSASKDHGLPFAEVFERYGRDFYKIDPALFSPAEVVFSNLDTGRIHRFGKLEPELLGRSLFAVERSEGSGREARA